MRLGPRILRAGGEVWRRHDRRGSALTGAVPAIARRPDPARLAEGIVRTVCDKHAKAKVGKSGY